MEMTEERALAHVRALEEVIDQLKDVRGNVDDFRTDDYKDAGGGLWAGTRRTRFTRALEDAKSDHARIAEQIGQAISDCKNKQRSLAFSINPLEHPIISAQAVAIALN
jgi:hypothetical protein